jgi:hypothetical protein
METAKILKELKRRGISYLQMETVFASTTIRKVVSGAIKPSDDFKKRVEKFAKTVGVTNDLD